MLIALSGVQGSGKTTILNSLKNLGYNVIERKTARSILTDWNITLEEAYADQALCRAFHDELLSRKQQDELFACTNSELWFTERSFADVFTYALISLGHFNSYSEWLDQYYKDCTIANAKYLGVFFLNAFLFPTQNDGIRGINKHYVKQVDENIRQISKQMAPGLRVSFKEIYSPANSLFDVVQEHVEQRVRFIAEKSHNLWLTERLQVTEEKSL